MHWKSERTRVKWPRWDRIGKITHTDDQPCSLSCFIVIVLYAQTCIKTSGLYLYCMLKRVSKHQDVDINWTIHFFTQMTALLLLVCARVGILPIQGHGPFYFWLLTFWQLRLIVTPMIFVFRYVWLRHFHKAYINHTRANVLFYFSQSISICNNSLSFLKNAEILIKTNLCQVILAYLVELQISL